MNPSGAGRAFGQKLGKLLEDEIHRVVQACLYGTDFNFIPKGKLTDINGKLCQHDGLIVDREGLPYAVIESKIIQKAKHATEKASKPAREHPDLKRANPTLRASIVVLAGDFTPEPLQMVESSGANLLFVPQTHIISVCRNYGLEILWSDRDAVDRAVAALETYQKLNQEQHKELGKQILEPVAIQLQKIVAEAIADVPENPAVGVVVDIFRQRGEILHREARWNRSSFRLSSVLERIRHYMNIRLNQKKINGDRFPNILGVILAFIPILYLSGIALAAKKEHIQQLKETRVCTECSLRNAELEGADLNGANLQSSEMISANLTDADLGGANLQLVDLRLADMHGAKLEAADLRGAHLAEAQLSRAILFRANLATAIMEETILLETNLISANLESANLLDAQLENANLESANLQKANLLQANLQKAILKEANLQEATLQDANLEMANLQGADLTATNLMGANLWRTNLQETKINDDTKIEALWMKYWEIVNQDLHSADLSETEIPGVNLQAMNLQGINLTQANLLGAFLFMANLQGAILDRINLRDANLHYTNLTNASLNEANLFEADLRRANLFGANLTKANLGSAIMVAADLRNTTFQEADLTGANLKDTQLLEANFSEANLSGVNLENADLRGANLIGANLDGANLKNANLCGAIAPDRSPIVCE